MRTSGRIWTVFSLLCLVAFSVALIVGWRVHAVDFALPYVPLLLPPLWLFTWIQHRRTVTDMSAGRKRLSITLRFVLLTLLVLSMAGTAVHKSGESLAVMFVVDGSRSIADEERVVIERYIANATKGRERLDKVGVITFAQDPHTQTPLTLTVDPTRPPIVRDTGVTTATDIAFALRSARNELDSDARASAKRIVLISDGNENAGNAMREMPELAGDRILLDTFTVPSHLTREALIDKMAIPPRVRIGEPFPVRVVVSSLTAQSASIVLTRDGKPTGDARRVDLHAGKNVVVFDQTIEKTGFYRYGATLDAGQDTMPENNRGEGFTWVHGKPTVLYVADSNQLTGFLQRALQSESIDVEYLAPEALPSDPAALQRYDSIFISNVMATDLTQNQMLALQIACRDFGIGFGMVGGQNSYGSGYYRGTPIEETLPVSMEVKSQKHIPSVAVALVIEDLEVPTSINMSIEAAKATVDNLDAIDQVGVLDCNQGGFGGNANAPAGTWRIPMTHVTDREAIEAQVQNLRDMGDPPSYTPFILEAARVLNGTDAKVKHIVFLGDGDAIYEANQGAMAAAIRKVRDMGITVSTIASGADAGEDVKFMATIAYMGGGQAYVANQPQDLPRLLLKDQETISQPPIIEEPFQAVPVTGDEVFKGVDWNSAPPLLGYNVVSPKPTAELSLLTHRKDPLFAAWRYGLGRSVAFLSDDRAKWAAQWVGWSGYAKFWAQAIRWTMRPFSPSEYSTQVALDNGRGHVVVDAIDAQGQYVDRLRFLARVAPPQTGSFRATQPLDIVLNETGPGHYEGTFDAPRVGTYLVNVREHHDKGAPDTSTVVGLSTAYPPEFRDTKPNRYLMTQLARAGFGRVDPSPAAVYGSERPRSPTPWPLAPMLMGISLTLLLLDIAVRRLALEWSDFHRAAAWVRGKKPASTKSAAPAPALDRLRDRKDAAVASREAASPPVNLAGLDSRAASPPRPPASQGAADPPVQTASRPTLEQPRAGAPAAANSPTASSPPAAAPEPPAEPEESGMSRLMAAKQRARERQDKDRQD